MDYMLFKFRHCLCLCLVAIFSESSFAESGVENFEIHSMYETWRLPENESMGMLALGIRKRFGDYTSLGADFYSAVDGQRGGFITLGMSGAIEYPISRNWLVEAGLHLGAGGGSGGYLLTGGGLMIRKSMGLKYVLTPTDAVSMGWSHVGFPQGGKIQSSQFYIAYDRAFNGLFQDGKPIFRSREVSASVWGDYESGYQQPALIVRNVVVPSALNRLDGQPQQNLQQVGIEWKSHVNSDSFIRMETVGAMGGTSAGYMHVMAGIGKEFSLTENLTAEASFNLGGGGGGGVDTGGGLLAEAAVGLRQNFFQDWYVKVAAGRMIAPDGSFRGTGYSVGVGRSFGHLSRQGGRSDAPLILDSHPIRMRTAQQTYVGHGSSWRNRPDQNVGNLGIQLDYFVSPSVFITGQGLAAYTGDAGAYMTGLVGAGYHLPLYERWFAETELLVGAAGGGGLAVGSGLVHQVNLGVGYQINDALSLQAGVGDIRAFNGPFSARTINLSLNYSFNLMSFKH